MKSWYYPVVMFIITACWGFLHSWLAALSTKMLAHKLFGEKINRVYRLIFVGFSLVTLTPILALLMILPSRVLWAIPTPWRYLTLIVQFAALVCLVWTIFQTDILAFIGLSQFLRPNTDHEQQFVMTGFYRFVRHPLYFFSIILIWLIPYVTDLLFALILAFTIYFLVGTIPEEKKLVDKFGKSYKEYQKNVPRIIPGLKINRN